MNSAIQLISHEFSKIELYPTDADDPKGDVMGSHTLSIRKSNSDENEWLARLDVYFKDAEEGVPSPYVGSFQIIGRFSLHPEFPEESRDQMVAMNTGAILYGAVREMIINLSARSLHGTVYIPTVDARSFYQPEVANSIDSDE